MKFKIDSLNLKKISRIFSNISYNNNYLVEMNGILFEIKKDNIFIEARNTYISLKFTSNENIEVINEGIFLVKAKLLNEVISKLENNEIITFNKVEENLITIKSKNSYYEINLLNHKNYKNEKFISDKKYNEIIINNFYFKKMIESIIFAGDERSNRKILQGINIKINDNFIKLLASDNVRIAFNKQKINYTGEKINKIIPIKAIKEYLKLINESEEIKLRFFENKMLILSSNLLVQINLIEGTFPNLENAFFDQNKNKLTIKKDLMLSLLDRALPLVLNKESNNTIITLKILKENLMIESNESEIGSSKVETADFKFEGANEFVIHFNPRLLKEAIIKLENLDLTLDFNTSEQPFIMKDSRKNNDFRCLILPFKI
ncbi:/ dnaN / DNA polymerase III subunit beta / 1531:2658 Forward [Candidatus Hepatoplasma crinochetorum]|uniref:/ dnaN / DNA polymerase III subunit beta / 1531:2658 Forward n=1 Tax=Candidatus Hepatoplasma crinochetorum TaxID=295596 RepID=A0A0G7ZLW1_9MOLU|nr:/ dnaN / DNA polymerase III subunit beta / 1531:2658 Forward [Candidatus Hepatoplasma crinochetorum]